MIDKRPRRGMHMSNEAQALAGAPQDAGDGEYEAFLGVLSSSARGRAFLAEHARRARQADTETLLAALARIEAMLAEQREEVPPSPPPRVQAPSPATALAAVAAQAIASAEDAIPEVKVIKAGTMPAPPPFAGDDFASGDAPTAEPPRETV